MTMAVAMRKILRMRGTREDVEDEDDDCEVGNEKEGDDEETPPLNSFLSCQL